MTNWAQICIGLYNFILTMLGYTKWGTGLWQLPNVSSAFKYRRSPNIIYTRLKIITQILLCVAISVVVSITQLKME